MRMLNGQSIAKCINFQAQLPGQFVMGKHLALRRWEDGNYWADGKCCLRRHPVSGNCTALSSSRGSDPRVWLKNSRDFLIVLSHSIHFSFSQV